MLNNVALGLSLVSLVVAVLIAVSSYRTLRAARVNSAFWSEQAALWAVKAKG